MSVNNILWHQMCCVHHGDYAEHPTKKGGVVRIKRSIGSDGYQVCEFDADGACLDHDDDGVPSYRAVDADELSALIA